MLRIGNNITVGKPIYKFHNNHSVDFDGVDDFIQLGQPISYTQHTISTWVKVSDTGASKTIIDARDANDDGIRIFCTSAEVVTYQLNTSDINSGSAISVNEWHHIVATYDGTTQKLYIDGSLVDSTATSQTITTTTNAEIGARNFSDRANEFAGKIDELAIYDRALTAAEVTEIYNGGKPTNLKLNSGNYKSADPVIVSTKSIDLDGTEEYLEVQANSTFAFGNTNFTLSSWFNLDELNDGFNYVVAIGNNSTGQQAGIGVTDAKKLFLSAFSSPIVQTSALQIEFGEWNHIVASYTGGSTDAVSFYLNGVLIDTLSISLDVQVGKVMIGAHVGETSFFNGQIDEVGIFNTALNSDQVIELYNQGVPSNLFTSTAGEDGTLVGYWKMGDGTLDEAPLIADQTNATLGSELVDNGDFSSDSDWDLDTGWSITNGKLRSDGTGNSGAEQTGVFNTSGKTFKITFDVNVDSGTLNSRVRFKGTGNTTISNITSAGSYTFYAVSVASQTALNFVTLSTNTAVYSIDNVSAKQVNGNPALMINTPTIVTDAPLTKIRNYYRMGDGLLDKHQADNITLYSTRGLICDMVEPSLGTELLTDGDFPAGTSAWNLGTGWLLEAGACVRSGASSNSDFRQSINITANKVYQISYTRVYQSGSTRTTNLFSDFETDGTNITLGDYRGTEETVTVVSFFMPTYTGTVPIRVFGINDWAGKITNVSLKEVNGVGALMTNMLNTDITNDVPS